MRPVSSISRHLCRQDPQLGARKPSFAQSSTHEFDSKRVCQSSQTSEQSSQPDSAISLINSISSSKQVYIVPPVLKFAISFISSSSIQPSKLMSPFANLSGMSSSYPYLALNHLHQPSSSSLNSFELIRSSTKSSN